jgi:hypothetical protein
MILHANIPTSQIAELGADRDTNGTALCVRSLSLFYSLDVLDVTAGSRPAFDYLCRVFRLTFARGNKGCTTDFLTEKPSATLVVKKHVRLLI